MRARFVLHILLLSALTSAIAGGCSTANKNASTPGEALLPPEAASWPINEQIHADKDFDSIDLFFSKVASENPSPNVIWWADYRRAQNWSTKDPNVACEIFSRLASEGLFPTRRIAYLRAHEICPTSNQILARLEPFDLNQFDEWLFEDALDVAIKKAERTNNYADLIDLHIRKSKLPLSKDLKVEHAKHALKYATQIKEQTKTIEIQQRLYDLSPSLNPNPTKSQILAVGNDFRQRRLFNQAREKYQSLVANKKATTHETVPALRGIRMSYKVEQKRPEYVLASKNLAKYVEGHFKKSRKTRSDYKLYVDTQLSLVRTLWTENNLSLAEKELEKTEKNISGKYSLAELYWIKARMQEEKGNHAGAAELFRKALAEPIENPNLTRRIQWFLAWNERKNKNFAEADKIFSELVLTTENIFDRNQIQFWHAKVLKDMGKDADAKKKLMELVEEDPLSYYGLLSHRELDRELPVHVVRQSKKATSQKMTRFLSARLDQKYIAWLAALREDRVALNYLNFISQQILKDSPSDEDTWVALLSLYASTNNFLGLFTQLGNLQTATRRSIIEKYPDLIFPKPYYETVSQSASRFGVSVEFIYAIMRQESSFNPRARSPMDAFGLMQLIPDVAQRSAKSNSINYAQAEDLYQPHINIALGTAHLRELWDKYNGELVLAAASYNASEKAIFNWLKTRYQGDPIEFIEDIPYDETRAYVKLVLRNLVTYQIMTTQHSKVNFPEWALKISQYESFDQP